MAIDFAGRCPKGCFTLYPFSLDYCNADKAKSYFDVGETAKESKIYEYAVGCMRAVTCLLTQEKGQKRISDNGKKRRSRGHGGAWRRQPHKLRRGGVQQPVPRVPAARRHKRLDGRISSRKACLRGKTPEVDSRHSAAVLRDKNKVPRLPYSVGKQSVRRRYQRQQNVLPHKQRQPSAAASRRYGLSAGGVRPRHCAVGKGHCCRRQRRSASVFRRQGR